MDNASRNSETLKDFARYCEEHPGERFWQALRNWKNVYFVLTSDHGSSNPGERDTFYLEGK